MNTISKKEIINTIEEAIGTALQKLKIPTPSKKTKKLLDKVSKKVSGQLRVEVKKQIKKTDKARKAVKNGVPAKKVKAHITKIEQA